MAEVVLKAPFPAFGGKSQVADMVWTRLGDCRNYIEPFAFSGAVLLRRPGGAGPIETINDLNCYVANFWRAVAADPAAVAAAADWPVIEDDLHARHAWLVSSDEAQHKLDRVRKEPMYFDATIAGWWCWGACCWIGSGWCDAAELRNDGKPREKSPGPLGGSGRGGVLSQQMPHIQSDAGCTGMGVTSWNAKHHTGDKRPQLCNDNTTAGPGVLSHVPPEKRVILTGFAPKGVNAHGSLQVDDTHRPQLADVFARGRGVNSNDSESTTARRRAWLTDWMMRLADRLRPVRVCCGHWARVCDSDSTLTRLGMTGVFLDPPYRKLLGDGTKNRSSHIYANDKIQCVDSLCDEVQAWCLKWGDSPEIRVALCGLEGEYPALDDAGWEKVPWKSRGGYGNRTDRGKENAARERIWFNGACVSKQLPRQHELFPAVVA